MIARRITRLGLGDGPLAASTIGLLGPDGGFELYPPRLESASAVFAPSVEGGAQALPVQSGGRRSPRVRYRRFVLPPFVASRSFVFVPIVEKNPPRPRYAPQRIEDDVVALMF